MPPQQILFVVLANVSAYVLPREVRYVASMRTGAISTVSGLVDVQGPPDPAHTEATMAASVWNMYYAGHAAQTVNVTAEYVRSWPAGVSYSNAIGVAIGTMCATGSPHKYCSVVKLQVLESWAALAFDIFIHEIAHAVIPNNATPVGRVLDKSNHWFPYEDGEVFGPAIALNPWMALYTARSVNPASSTACGQGHPCSNGNPCFVIPGTRNMPGVCTALTGAPTYGPTHREPHTHGTDVLFVIPVFVFFIGTICLVETLTVRRQRFETTSS